jgi:glyoxylase-like metal-dependent hydrolase (beta-lactamase superfamily II)
MAMLFCMTHRRGMTRRRALALSAALLATVATVAASPAGRPTVTSSPTSAADLGVPVSAAELHAALDAPGPVEVETVIGASWSVARSGLLNLAHPKAKAAGLVDGDEPIHIAFHALRHPTRGTYLVDTGVERAFRDDPEHALLAGVVGRVMRVDRIAVTTDTRTWIDREVSPPRGVFLTHLHADHVSGMRDLPAGTPVYVGPGEAHERAFQNVVVRPIVDAALAGKGPLREWHFQSDADGEFDGILDVFGDRSVFAISVPGHTSGSTAFVARTPRGPVLFTGDACHTAWGWANGVEPGSFSDDKPQSAASLAKLEALARRHPGMDVRLGHQDRVPSPSL